jgi:hypothetical protein
MGNKHGLALQKFMTTIQGSKANDVTKAIRTLWALTFAIFLQECSTGNVDWRGLVVMAAVVLTLLVVKNVFSTRVRSAKHHADHKNMEAFMEFSLHHPIDKVHHDVK